MRDSRPTKPCRRNRGTPDGSTRRLRRVALLLPLCAAFGISGCTFRPIDDPKYGRLDTRIIFERAIDAGFFNKDIPAPLLRSELEALLEPNASLADDERTLTALGAQCRREQGVVRCFHRRQVRWTATLMPPFAVQHEFEIAVASNRQGGRELSVCYGWETADVNTDYRQPQKWRCSPKSAVATPCKGRPRRTAIQESTVWDCSP
jgi:hypothetical protein